MGRQKKYYYGPSYMVTGPLAENHMFQIIFENATIQLTQKVEGHFTKIYFGSGILRIFHNPLKFEFFPETGENLKLKIVNLVTTHSNTVYCGNLTEIDGFEVSYQGIESIPIISTDASETIIYFLLHGYTRVVGINQDRTLDIPEDLKKHISITDLTIDLEQ